MDVCLRVRDFAISRSFYGALGFVMVEGEPERGWGIFVSDGARIGLFVEGFMNGEPFTLNFRGGCIPDILESLAKQQIEPTNPPVLIDRRAGSFRLHDPDGNLIFIDSAPGEIRRG